MLSENPVILMADDSSTDCDLVRMALKRLDFPCTLKTVSDGSALLTALKGGSAPTLILLDLNMPVMGGFEVLEAIKSDPGLQDIPIVVWSTSGISSDVLRAYQLGANSFLTKPDSFDKVVQAMDTLSDFWFAKTRLAVAPTL